MNDISNKTLAVLVIIAILISLAGLYFGRARIVTVGKAPTELGLVNVTVVSNVNLAISGGVNFTTLMAPGDPGQASHLGGTVCNPGLCNITVGSIGTSKSQIRFYSSAGLFVQAPTISNYFNASTANIGYLPSPINQLLSPCATDIWVGGAYLGAAPYKNVPIGSPGSFVVEDCEQYEGFTMAIQVRVPAAEPSGVKTATLNFVGSEDIT